MKIERKKIKTEPQEGVTTVVATSSSKKLTTSIPSTNKINLPKNNNTTSKMINNSSFNQKMNMSTRMKIVCALPPGQLITRIVNISAKPKNNLEAAYCSWNTEKESKQNIENRWKFIVPFDCFGDPLIPNRFLRNLIDSWLASWGYHWPPNGFFGIRRSFIDFFGMSMIRHWFLWNSIDSCFDGNWMSFQVISLGFI